MMNKIYIICSLFILTVLFLCPLNNTNAGTFGQDTFGEEKFGIQNKIRRKWFLLSKKQDERIIYYSYLFESYYYYENDKLYIENKNMILAEIKDEKK